MSSLFLQPGNDIVEPRAAHQVREHEGPIAAHSLFRLEWNLRMATVVGLIGAGGIGQALYDAQQLMFYRPMMAYLLVTVAIVAAADFLNERTRAYFGWSYLAR